MAKVLLVAHWDWVLAHFRLPIARALREHGAEVVLVCPPGSSVAAIQREGFRCIPWRVVRRGLTPHREAAAIARLAAIYRRERPQAVHHFTIKPVLYGSIAAALVRTPVVVNVFSGLGFVFGQEGRVLRRLLVPLLRWVGHRASTWTFTLNPEDLADLRSQRVAPSERSGMLPEGVDTNRFTPMAPPPDREVPVVLMASRLLHDKGVGELVEAANSLGARDVLVDVRIAGAPDPGNPATVTPQDLQRWQRNSNVTFLGPRSDIDMLLRNADIAVLPTRYKEGLPWFLLEAGASGLPLVATDVPGCRDVVQHGVTGLRVPHSNPVALADAIARLAEALPVRRRMGQKAREFVVAFHSERRVVDRHVELYRQLGVLSCGNGHHGAPSGIET